MRIRFIEVPTGRDYKVGQEAEFKGFVEESYARKFISRGWAIDVTNERKPPEPKPELPKPDVAKAAETREPAGAAAAPASQHPRGAKR